MANKLTLKVTKLAFYEGHLVYPNEIIKNFKGDKVPSWATLAGGKEAATKGNTEQKKNQAPVNPQTPKKDEQELDNVGQGEADAGNDGTKDEGVLDNAGQGEEQNTGETDGQKNPEEKTEAELQAELDELLNESVALNIIIEDAENKTIAQQIEELKVLLGKN